MTLHKVISIKSRSMKFKCSSPDFPKLIIDFLKDSPDAKEELDPGFPLSFGSILESTILVYLDHARDLLNHQFLTGILGFVVNFPVLVKPMSRVYRI